MEVAIRDRNALLRRTETHAWVGGSWQRIDSVTYGYDHANRLISRTFENGASASASYAGDFKTSETDEYGVQRTYTPDAAGRVEVETLVGSGSIPSLATKYEYNGINKVVKKTVGHNLSEKIIIEYEYDDAGRLKKEIQPGNLITEHEYTPSQRKQKITYPGGGTREETYYADGRLLSITGTAVIAEYHTHSIDSGHRLTEIKYGTSSSPRWQKTWTDALGRVAKSERPGFGPSSQQSALEENVYDSTTGQLLKTTRRGYAPTRYGYDHLGQVVRTGLDIDDNTLQESSADRITDTNRYYSAVSGSSGLWLIEETFAYPYSNGTAKRLSTVRRRMTEFASGIREEIVTLDASDNVTTRSVGISGATTTVSTTRPGVSSTEVETSINGLTTATQGHDGLTVTTEYDALHRPWRVTFPRGIQHTSTYVSGTDRPHTTTDGAGKVTTYGYDNAGRRNYVKDAADQDSFLNYNARGQILRQWGSGSYPVAFEYHPDHGFKPG